MGLFFFGNRLMDFFANLMILLLLRVFKIETVISMTSILFFSSFSILAVIVFKGVENSPEDSVEVSQSEIDLSAS
ncbi:hypothetical protein MHBO_003770 [Bonamia ostreae]|uniref:Uncharacterized protein n=1 Tax=Bonamia ostreae TaxID=126728 RepID=A0ABV2ARF7_9EUKA